MDSAIIIAIVSLIGTVITGFLQFRKDKAEIKKVEIEGEKSEIDAVTDIADLVFKMYKNELDSLREICNDLRERNKFLQEQLTQALEKSTRKSKMIEELEDKLRQCVKENRDLKEE